jgi:hypothetical protein
MKSLEKDRARRYETASGLAEDIRRHLEHEPVLARGPGTGYRLHKFLRRHRVQAIAALAIVVVAGAVIVILSLWNRDRLRLVEAEGYAKDMDYVVYKILVPKPNEPLVPPEARVYNARDNRALVSLGMLADNGKPLPERRRHKLDPVYPLDNEEVSRLYNGGDMFLYFYQLYIRDFKVQAQAWPHRPDSYLLISAGADGIYGTNDDICNFGR